MVFLPSNLGFLFLSRCLIFKVQSPASLEDSSKSISYIYSLVNTFLKSFSSFLYRLFSSLSSFRGKACIYYHFPFSLSTTFQHFLWKVFPFPTPCRVLSGFNMRGGIFTFIKNRCIILPYTCQLFVFTCP